MKKNDAITPREVDMAKWYSEICLKAELMDYSKVKGFIIYRPYGYAIWEQIKNYLDHQFKLTGHENVYMPLLIPQSLLQKEADHISGFFAADIISRQHKEKIIRKRSRDFKKYEAFITEK